VGELRWMVSSTQISNNAQQIAPTPPPPKRADDRAKSDLWIFREGRREVSGPAMVRDVVRRLDSGDALPDCLIQAGELEAALADLNSPGAPAAARLTDALAVMLCTGDAEMDPNQLAGKIDVPETISISPPEGFTYYALHPLDFAKVADRIADHPANCAVIGVRSIGTTLSAVTTAALKARGRAATRITVRPSGHPYARSAEFSPEQERWIAEQLFQSAQFLVVDEGPGRSGSTFLSVAEALARRGVPEARITIVGSREFDPEGLCAENAAQRWRGLTYVCAAPSISNRFLNFPYIGGGDWRTYFCGAEQEWPESWTQMERLKFLSPDRRHFFKFEGMGPLGREVRERAFALAAARFSPVVSDAGDGFLSYTAIEGRPLRKQDVSSSLLEQIARYCSFRASEFACAAIHNSELDHMLEFNVQQEFGRELKLKAGQLTTENPLLADGRMQPYEWIAPNSGTLLKTDAISHGDNHFFPGPCDIAWDLAGTVVEWDLDAQATKFLLGKFRQFSGAPISQQFQDYMLAYCVFRLGFCKMATSTVTGSREESRLESSYLNYRTKAQQLLASRAV
jgi:hypothetical protein